MLCPREHESSQQRDSTFEVKLLLVFESDFLKLADSLSCLIDFLLLLIGLHDRVEAGKIFVRKG